MGGATVGGLGHLYYNKEVIYIVRESGGQGLLLPSSDARGRLHQGGEVKRSKALHLEGRK